jgi:transketolase
MRNAFSEQLYQEALRDDRIHIVVADISPVGSMQKFREEFPDRFHNVGVAEQAMIGIAAGLALKGKTVFCYSIATFALFRCFEFIRVDLCYQNLKVIVVGMGAGMSYADHGYTHHAIEDVAIASAIPNMQVIAPCDPFETAEAVKWCARENKGPVYLRLGKSGEPVLNTKEPWRFGHIRQLTPDLTHNSVLTYGPIVSLTLAAANRATIFSCHTLKPLDRKYIEDILELYDRVIVVEEHVPHGGLSSRVKEIWCDMNNGGVHGIDCFTLKDEFVHCNGNRNEMLAAHGLIVEAILEKLK